MRRSRQRAVLRAILRTVPPIRACCGAARSICSAWNATRSQWIRRRRRYRHSTTRPRSISPARFVTRQFTGLTRTTSSSNSSEGEGFMDDGTHKVFLRKIRVPGFLLFATTLLSAGLWAQQASETKKTAAGETKQSAGPVATGVSVDAARKSADLPTTATTDDNEGQTLGGYVTKQSAEFGGRISDFTGNQGTWDTFVNLGTGPRLLEYNLDMHSPTHIGTLFDDLSFSGFGYGGDPNDLSRLRISKGAAYTFGVTFRRDQNGFDYNLLANPLNPSTSSPNIPVLNSPHEFLLTRRMTDTNLSLFPLAPVRFKMGWSRVVNEGTSFTTVHEGTEPQLIDRKSTRLNSSH